MAGGALTFYGVAKMQSAMLEGESLSLLSLPLPPPRPGSLR